MELNIVCLFETAFQFVAVAQLDIHMILLVGYAFGNFRFYFRRLIRIGLRMSASCLRQGCQNQNNASARDFTFF